MKKFLLAVTLALTALTASAASNDYYTELNYGVVNLKTDGVEASPTVATIKLGVNVTDIWALEAVLGTSVSGDDVTYRGQTVPVDVKVNDLGGIFLKGNYEVNDKFTVFLKGGVMHASMKASALGASAKSSDTGFAYGVGAQYDVTNKVYATVDYMDYSNVSKNLDASGPSIGLGYKF